MAKSPQGDGSPAVRAASPPSFLRWLDFALPRPVFGNATLCIAITHLTGSGRETVVQRWGRRGRLGMRGCGTVCHTTTTESGAAPPRGARVAGHRSRSSAEGDQCHVGYWGIASSAAAVAVGLVPLMAGRRGCPVLTRAQKGCRNPPKV